MMIQMYPARHGWIVLRDLGLMGSSSPGRRREGLAENRRKEGFGKMMKGMWRHVVLVHCWIDV
jgi:hypothetical protein